MQQRVDAVVEPTIGAVLLRRDAQVYLNRSKSVMNALHWATTIPDARVWHAVGLQCVVMDCGVDSGCADAMRPVQRTHLPVDGGAIGVLGMDAHWGMSLGGVQPCGRS